MTDGHFSGTVHLSNEHHRRRSASPEQIAAMTHRADYSPNPQAVVVRPPHRLAQRELVIASLLGRPDATSKFGLRR
jgi:hypothetical protein